MNDVREAPGIEHVLGKNTTNYSDTYNVNTLARELRSRNREQYGITGSEFSGVDIWHGYEASFLLNNGSPINGLVKLIYPASSKYIVESKSLKLYLFSFMMEKLGSTVINAVAEFESIVKRDLEVLLETSIQFKFFYPEQITMYSVIPDGFRCIDELASSTTIQDYSENLNLLETRFLDVGSDRIQYYSNVLRSRCKITSQSDFATILIDMQGSALPTMKSLYSYLVSFRNENHFHEEVVEAIYYRLLQKFEPEDITVIAYFTRRGGLDINPIRSNKPIKLDERPLSDINCFSYRSTRS